MAATHGDARGLMMLTRSEAEDFLIREARLIDDRRLAEWHTLYTADGIYWIPLDEAAAPTVSASIIYDSPLRREERVHHLLHNVYPAQSPRSRTLHFVSNVAVEGMTVRSNQIVFEMRTGDYQQIGLGEVKAIVAEVEHILVREAADLRIARKKILLINRDAWLGNLTFLL